MENKSKENKQVLHFQVFIHPMQKCLPTNYSFTFVLIILTKLVSMRIIQKNEKLIKMKLVGLISIYVKE